MTKSHARILYVGNHASYFLTHRLPVFQSLQESGCDVHVAVPAKSDALGRMIDADAIETIERLGFHFHDIPISRGSINPINELRTLYYLFRLYRTLKPELIYHATVKPVLYGGLMSRIVGIPGAIFGVTGLGYLFVASGFKGLLIRMPIKLAFRLALSHPNAHTIFQNYDDYEAFVHQNLVNARNATVIKGSGVDLSEYNYLEETNCTPIVVLISRMLWDKGVREFVEAARILSNAGTKGRFVLVGDSDPDNPASVPQSQLRAWQDQGIIEWWGWRKDIPSILQQSHIVSLPSYYPEGVPKCLIEAAACGKPIVTTNMPGCKEIVEDGINGFLVPPRDTSSLAESIRQLIENPELRQEMGRRSREIAESEFSIEKVVGATIEICNKLLNVKMGK